MQQTPFSKQLHALSPLDGRYQARLVDIASVASEAGLIRYRVRIELRWLALLSKQDSFFVTQLPQPIQADYQWLEQLEDECDHEKIKAIEKRINHDVKAVEYWIKSHLEEHSVWSHYVEFVHFACTSEDINNLAYALMIKDIRIILVEKLARIQQFLVDIAQQSCDIPMLSLTHGQAASPTTMGKEIVNSCARLDRQRDQFIQVAILGKYNGAVGNFNAHSIALPQLDWQRLSSKFVQSLGLVPNSFTTQIEPHDYIAQWCHALMRINTILIDLAKDVWGYVSRGYFVLALQQGEVGSSTMPHKVNPIDFENAEGNLAMANAMLGHMANTLPISRWQRDLSDSTLLRNVGSCAGYTALAWDSLCKGLQKITPNAQAMREDLDNNPEVITEAVQTVMRRFGLPEPYEQLKALSRGKSISLQDIRTFVQQLDLPQQERERLLALSPDTYTGLASSMARQYLDDRRE